MNRFCAGLSILLFANVSSALAQAPGRPMPAPPPMPAPMPTMGFQITQIQLTPLSPNDEKYSANITVQPIGNLGVNIFPGISVYISDIKSLENLKDQIKPEVDKKLAEIIKNFEENKAAYDRQKH